MLGFAAWKGRPQALVASLVLALAPALAAAGGYALPNPNPRDLGLAASAVAAQRGAGATYGNPAALARADGFQLQLGAGLVDIRNTWSDPAGVAGDVSMKRRVTPFPTAFASWGGKFADRGFGVGLGVTTFGGAEVRWPDDWPGRYRIVKVDRQVLLGVLGAGAELAPGIRIGGGALYYRTDQTLQQKVALGAFVPGLPDATGTLKTDGGALSFDAAAEVDVPGMPITLGLDYKHKATQRTEGTVRWNGVPPPIAAAPQGVLLRNQDVDEVLTIPNVLNVGASWRVLKPVLVTFTYTFDRWRVYDGDTFVGSPQPEGVTPALRVARDYRNGHVFRAGAEVDVGPAVQVRAGVLRDFSGARSRTFSPTLPDAPSWAAAVGLTWRLPAGLFVDAAAFYANMDRVKATNVGVDPPASPAPIGTFRGTYDIQAFIYGLSLGWSPTGGAR